jgi:hypothetical protein
MAPSQFSGPRFKRLLGAYFTENGRMLYRAIVAYGILSFSIWIIVTALMISNDEAFFMPIQVFLFVVNGFLFPVLASGWFYGRLNSAERQISFLVVPATHFEKHLLSTIMSIVLPTLIGIGTYYIGEICGMALHNNLAKPSQYFYNSPADEFYGTPLFLEVVQSSRTGLICITYVSFLLLATTFFQFFTLHFTKYALFKIVLLLLALITTIALFVYLTLESLKMNENALFRYTRYLFNPSSASTYDYDILIFVVPAIISSLILWIASFIRLKEYQLK